jgi:hypothetical protein
LIYLRSIPLCSSSLKDLSINVVANMDLNLMSRYSSWAVTSVTSSVLLMQLLPQYSVGGSYIWTAILLFLAQWLVYGIYAVILYPRYFSPLRHLPGPSVRDNPSCEGAKIADCLLQGGSFLMGQFPTILAEPAGLPMRRWINDIPNDGIIRYK